MLQRLVLTISIFILFCHADSLADVEQFLKDLGGPRRGHEYELSFLPPYCCKISSNRARFNEWKKWVRKFESKGARGRDHVHVHHYCEGLLALNRIFRGVGKRSALLGVAESQFNYMISKCSPKFILMPEIYLKMGITQKLMGKDGEAFKHFLQATKLKRDYVSAYIHIIDFFKEHQNYKKAIETARRGLKYSPNSKLLKAKLAELQSLSTGK